MKMSEPHARTHIENRPWYRQFWPWFLIALPGSVVIASFVTLAIAIRHSDAVVRDDYYKEGLAINQMLNREQQARVMQLTATLTWHPASGEIRVTLPARIVDQRLQLHWLHPLKRQMDRDIVLIRRSEEHGAANNAVYGGQVDALFDGRFYVQLENITADSNNAWRLRGEITAPTPASLTADTRLTP